MIDNTIQLRLVQWQDELPSLRAIREAVFVREQRVPVELEWDAFDADSVHVLASTSQGEAVGTARLLPDGRIGRMAVVRARRGNGIGSAMLHCLLEHARRNDMMEVKLHAQVSARDFYTKFGFQVVGEEFMEAGIAHVEMRLKLT